MLDHGSEFTVTLPIRHDAKMQTWIPSQPLNTTIEPGGHINPSSEVDNELPKILLIEDHPDVRTYLKKILHNHYLIVETNDGKSGLTTAFAEIPDLIVSDIMMPQMDGFTLCQNLKSDERTSHIPIILLTAKSTQDDRLQGLGEGADAYLIKPFDQRELILRIEKLLENRDRMMIVVTHY